MKRKVKMRIICAVGAILLSGGMLATAHNVANDWKMLSQNDESKEQETVYYTEEEAKAFANVGEEKRIYGYPTSSYEYEVEDETEN